MPFSYEECCQLLELKENPTKTEVKKAYRHLALKCHPDKAPPGKTKEYEEKFKQISEAYNDFVVADFDKRQFLKKNLPEKKSQRNQTIIDMINLVKQQKSTEEKQLFKNINHLQEVLSRWDLATRYIFSDSHSQAKQHQQVKLLQKMETYFIFLRRCMHLDASGHLEPNNLWNKALIRTCDILVAAIDAIDALPTPDSLYGNVCLLFDPIINIMENAQSTVIEPLAELKKITDTLDVHNDALTLATTLLQRANQNFNHRFSYFSKGDTSSSICDYDPYPAIEMATLGNFLEKAVEAKQNPLKAKELNQEVNKYHESNHSTTSLYWKKFKNSLYILMEKIRGVHSKRAPKGTHFDEKIKANKFISSLKKFSPPPKPKPEGEKKSTTLTMHPARKK